MTDTTTPRFALFARVKQPRPHRLVALGLTLTAGSKLLLAGVLFLFLLTVPEGSALQLGVGSLFFALYALLELRVMRAAWRGRIGRLSWVTVIAGGLLFAAASVSASLDGFGTLNVFTAVAGAYGLSLLGLLLGHRRAAAAPAA